MHAQSTLISMQYLKKEGRDEVDFLHADEHQIILQGVGMVRPGQTKLPKITSLQNICNISRKK